MSSNAGSCDGDSCSNTQSTDALSSEFELTCAETQSLRSSSASSSAAVDVKNNGRLDLISWLRASEVFGEDFSPPSEGTDAEVELIGGDDVMKAQKAADCIVDEDVTVHKLFSRRNRPIATSSHFQLLAAEEHDSEWDAIAMVYWTSLSTTAG